MLTKEEREEIAKRFKSCTKVDFSDIYRGLFGRPTPKETTIGEDDKATLNRLLDLCDTSNMLELPRDKDGEVIRPCDVVYDDDNIKYVVVGYMTSSNSTDVILRADKKSVNIVAHAEALAHKKPITIESFVERIKNALDNIDDTTLLPYVELSRIADELESLGDSND